MDPLISANRMTVDNFLNGDFMEGCDEEDIQDDEAVCLLCRSNFRILILGIQLGTEDGDAEAGGYDSDGNASFASVDDFDGLYHFL
jgi:hypothetical protein